MLACFTNRKSHSNLLQTSPVAGFQYYNGEQMWHQIDIGDEVTLVRRSNNPYDSKAIEIYWRDKKLGYVPRAHN